jgi:hypothetical protein
MTDRPTANLAEWIDQFREYLRVANRPLTTVRAYGVALRQYQAFIENRELTIDAAIAFAQQLNVAPVAKSNYLAAVSRFYRFLIGRGLIEITNRDWERFREFRHDLGRLGERMPHPPSDEPIQTVLERAHTHVVKPLGVRPDEKSSSIDTFGRPCYDSVAPNRTARPGRCANINRVANPIHLQEQATGLCALYHSSTCGLMRLAATSVQRDGGGFFGVGRVCVCPT